MDVLGDVQRRGCLNNARGRNMLTERERKWLEFRKYRKAPCGDETHRCVGCMVKCGCSLTPDWIDAAEF